MKRNYIIHCICSIVFLHCLSTPASDGQNITRPPIFGIAKMTYLVSDYQLARDYYGTFLGFSEAFKYPSPLGEVVSFKVNDRQFLEFVQDRDAKEKTRLVSVSFETNDVEQMRLFLQSRNVTVPDAVTVDGAGNRTILVHDDAGVPVEFIDLNPNSLHKKSAGQFISENRISKRIHHAGLFTKEVIENPRFYKEVLGCRELFKSPEEPNAKLVILYLQLPDCVEFIEHYAAPDPNFSHPCFVAESMQDVMYTLKERNGNRPVPPANVGRGRKYILNISNSDGTKVEFVEPYNVR
jgi:catechol 2,3-dioxygenase-like lactoylglutathione lyase family enzyme